MRLDKALFPYPVLSETTDDFSDGLFTASIQGEVIDSTKVELKIEINIDNPEIENLLKEGKAEISILIESSLTSFRKRYVIENNGKIQTITLNAQDLSEKLEINIYVSATEQIKDYYNPGFNADYYGKDFVIPSLEKGSILAYASMVELSLNYSKSEKPKISSIIRVASTEQNYMFVDLDSDSIRINLPSKAYNAYVTASKSDVKKQQLMLITIILPGLTYVVEKIISGRVYEDSMWYKSFEVILEKRGIRIEELANSDEDSMKIAQELLNFPVESTLFDFYEEMEEEVQ